LGAYSHALNNFFLGSMVCHFICILDFDDYRMQTSFLRGAFLYAKGVLTYN
jgi:hypothetical protein